METAAVATAISTTAPPMFLAVSPGFTPNNAAEKRCRIGGVDFAFASLRTSVMPQTEVLFYKEGAKVPVNEWLVGIPLKAQRKCLMYPDMLEQQEHELRRPTADFLRDGIYELRPACQSANYRILYFFSGRNAVGVSHGIVKEADVPEVEVNRAIERKQSFEADPEAHTYRRKRTHTGE